MEVVEMVVEEEKIFPSIILVLFTSSYLSLFLSFSPSFFIFFSKILKILEEFT